MLWLWYRLAATALVRPLDWEPPYAAGMALKRQKDKRQKKNKKKYIFIVILIGFQEATELDECIGSAIVIQRSLADSVELRR